LLPHLVFLSLALNAAPSPTAQRLADTQRRLESAQTTKEATSNLEAERARLGEAWLREEAEATRAMNLEQRVSRYTALIVEARARKLASVESFLDGQAQPSFEQWLQECDRLLARQQVVRALAWRMALLSKLPADSPLQSLRADVATRGFALLRGGKGAFESYALRAIEALVRSQPIAIPDELSRIRALKTPPAVTSQCSQLRPQFPVHAGGQEAAAQVRLGSCSATVDDRVETRQVSYTETELVAKEETYNVQEARTVTENLVKEVCTESEKVGPAGCRDTSVGRICEMERTKTCAPQSTLVTRTEIVDVPHTRMVNVPVEVQKVEAYAVTIRTFVAGVDVESSIEGDGQRVQRSEHVSQTVQEEDYTSAHAGQAHFSGAGSTAALRKLQTAVEASFESTRSQWNTARGTALLGPGADLDQLVRAAVLTVRISPRLAEALSRALGVTPAEAAILVEPHVAVLALPPAPQGAPVTLPPPDEDLDQSLDTYENKVALVRESGIFAGLQLGVLIAGSRDSSAPLRLGFGGAVPFGYRPAFSVQSPVLLRLAGNLEVGSLGYVHFDTAVRVEVGVDVGRLAVAALGLGQVQGSIVPEADASLEPYLNPVSGGGGYGARLQLAVLRFTGAMDGKPVTHSLGFEVLAARVHRTLRADALGSRVEAQLFWDFGSIVKANAAVKVNSNADLPKFFVDTSRQMFVSLGLQSDY